MRFIIREESGKKDAFKSKFRIIKSKDASYTFEALSEGIYKLIAVDARNQELQEIINSKTDRIGTLYALVNNELHPTSIETDKPQEYIPAENYNWINLSLEEIGFIHGTDKSSIDHSLLEIYEENFNRHFGNQWRDNSLKILEIGTQKFLCHIPFVCCF